MTDEHHSGFLVQQIAELRREIKQLRDERVTYIQGDVTATDTGSNTFTAQVAGLVDGSTATLAGIKASASFLPTVGDSVLLALSGAQPIYQPGRVAGGAIGTVELSDDAVTIPKLASDVTLSIDGKSTVTFSVDPATGSGTQDGDLWFQYRASDDMIIGSWQWDGAAWTLRTFDDQVLGSLSAAKIITGTLAAGVEVTVGDPDAEHTLITSTGISANVVDEDDNVVEIARYGRDWSVRNGTTGEIVGSMTEDGDLDAATLTVTESDPVFGGVTLSELFAPYPRGIVARGELVNVGITASTDTEAAIGELAVTLEPGRSYMMFWPHLEYIVGTSDKFALRFRYTTDGSAPSTSSTELAAASQGKLTTGWNTQVPYFWFIEPPETSTDYRILATYGVGTGATDAQVNLGGSTARNWVIMDLGLYVEDTFINLASTGSTSGGGGSTPIKKTYVYESGANWQRTWNASGSVIYDNEMHQGYGDSFNGIRVSSAGWTALPDMTGATVDKVEIYLESYHWWNMGGGTSYMGAHGQTSEPASWAGNSGSLAIVQTGFTARSQGKWINVTNASGWKAAVAAETFKGISLSAPNTSATYYGKFRGSTYGRPRIRITYTK